MSDHITETDLDKLHISPEEVSSEDRHRIEAHLKQCSLCREHAQKLKAFYENVSINLQSPPSERDSTLAEKLLVPKEWIPTRKRLALPLKALEKVETALDAYAEIIEPYKRPLAQRVVRYIQIHPVRIASGFSLAAALVIAAISLFRPVSDTHPAYARAKDEFLIVYNQHGDELWRKHIGYGYDAENFGKHSELGLKSDDYLKTVDVDGDGRKEIIAIDAGALGLIGKNAVVCFQSDGTIRWMYEIHRDMTFGTQHFSDQYQARQLFAEDVNHDGHPEVIISASHVVYYPSIIVALNGSDGRPIGEHWESGIPRRILLYDLDGDKVKELIVPGENNSYDQAYLTILDPRELRGHSPATAPYTAVGVPDGNERAYLLFPRSDVQSIASMQSSDSRKRNRADHCIQVSDSLFLVWVVEYWNEKDYAALMYYFNTRLECVRVDASDPFVMLHRRLESEGKLTKKLDTEYFEELRRGVRYWDGEKFVNAPTMNKLYSVSKALPGKPFIPQSLQKIR